MTAVMSRKPIRSNPPPDVPGSRSIPKRIRKKQTVTTIAGSISTTVIDVRLDDGAAGQGADDHRQLERADEDSRRAAGEQVLTSGAGRPAVDDRDLHRQPDHVGALDAPSR